MKYLITLYLLPSLYVFFSSAKPIRPRDHGPSAFILTGDSTTAALNPSGGGWGNGFLTTLHDGAIGSNHGYDGATTSSFLSAAGLWQDAIEQVPRSASSSFTPYVTIQFGHNDQKATSGITPAQYQSNLEFMGTEIQEAGGFPILVTPISRRNFNATTGLVIEDLAPQAALTIAAANAIGAAYIDLNKASVAYLNSIGKSNAQLYNRIPTDGTHLNVAGAILFGNMVSILMDEAVTSLHGYSLTPYTHPNATVAAAIKSGTFLLPSPFQYAFPNPELEG